MNQATATATNQVERTRPTHRRIVERIVVTGTLRLLTPAHFGNGDTDSLTDMPLLADELDGLPLLTGASLTGALRNYLRERQLGDWCPAPPPSNQDDDKETLEQKRERESFAAVLFGSYSGDKKGGQSPLIVHDALGIASDYEMRDGVRIDPETRTAEDEKQFDFELLAAGSSFDLRFELLIGEPKSGASADELRAHRDRLLCALATALDGLTERETMPGGLKKSEITLGARKRRGFGRCSVNGWTVRRYDLRNRAGLLAWLAEDRGSDNDPWAARVELVERELITDALGGIQLLPDNRRRVFLVAEFALDGSLMVRSGAPDGESEHAPDMVHLHSPRPNARGELKPQPILAGTSWAGALRSRATQIAFTLAGDANRARATELLDGLFGPAEIKAKMHGKKEESPVKASRIEIAETEIQGGRQLEQTRIKVDRFTGGAFESALFGEQPLFGNDGTRLRLELSLRQPVVADGINDAKREAEAQTRQAEIGLLLLLLKDLCSGDLPLGGENGIGRGRLRGVNAVLTLPSRETPYTITQNRDGELTITGDRAELQSFVAALHQELSHA